MKNLVVGDVHATPDELEDCEGLLELVAATAMATAPRYVTFTGDLYNTHDAVSVKVMAFWRRWFAVLLQKGFEVVVARGNHDQVSPSDSYPHALLAHPEVRTPEDADAGVSAIDNVVVLPYYYDPAAFVADARRAHRLNPGAHTLICHQTFQGATYENGFYAKDAVQLADVPFDTVISGHIHSPQEVGKVRYVGAPRWRTRSDVNIDRHLYLFRHLQHQTELLTRIPTGQACRRLWALDDRPDLPAELPAVDRLKDKLWVDVYGPTAEYVRAREAELKASWGAVTRGFPDREHQPVVTEAMGVDAAFAKFAAGFQAPHGTAPEALQALLGARLG